MLHDEHEEHDPQVLLVQVTRYIARVSRKLSPQVRQEWAETLVQVVPQVVGSECNSP